MVHRPHESHRPTRTRHGLRREAQRHAAFARTRHPSISTLIVRPKAPSARHTCRTTSENAKAPSGAAYSPRPEEAAPDGAWKIPLGCISTKISPLNGAWTCARSRHPDLIVALRI